MRIIDLKEYLNTLPLEADNYEFCICREIKPKDWDMCYIGKDLIKYFHIEPGVIFAFNNKHKTEYEQWKKDGKEAAKEDFARLLKSEIENSGLTMDEVFEKFNISKESMEKARKVLDSKQADLIAGIDNGTMSTDEALAELIKRGLL